ncbi:MAG: histidine kinase [Ignavibacteriales bacterium]|nr:histidine kinase [Ignavibacteriales bacterium]
MKFTKPFFIGGIWLILGLIYSSQSFFYSLSVGREFIWQRSLFHSFVFCVEWGLLTVPVLRLAEIFRLDSTTFVRNLFIHFAAGLIIAFLQQSVYVIVTDFVESGFVFQRTAAQLFPSIIGFVEYGVLMYWSIVFVHHATRYYRNYQDEQKYAIELRSQLVESQLQSLKMQLQPHFLFNTLNAISVLVKKEPALAQKMIVRLSDLLRLTLERGNENTIALEQEIHFLDTYLAIEKVRFGERMKVRTAIAEETRMALVPTFILQPLVENAVRHGIAKRPGSGWIEINGAAKDGRLVLEVIDGGLRRARIQRSERSMGVGLENTRKRLQQMYGSDYIFEFKENNKNGITVTMKIPLSF